MDFNAIKQAIAQYKNQLAQNTQPVAQNALNGAINTFRNVNPIAKAFDSGQQLNLQQPVLPQVANRYLQSPARQSATKVLVGSPFDVFTDRGDGSTQSQRTQDLALSLSPMGVTKTVQPVKNLIQQQAEALGRGDFKLFDKLSGQGSKPKTEKPITVFHGGDKGFIEQLIKTKNFVSDAVRDAGTGGNRFGLSTSTDPLMAKDFSTSSTGNPGVAEIKLSPKARVFELKGKAMDDLSESEIRELAKKFDVIKDVDNFGGEGEIRILNPKVLDKTRLKDIRY